MRTSRRTAGLIAVLVAVTTAWASAAPAAVGQVVALRPAGHRPGMTALIRGVLASRAASTGSLSKLSGGILYTVAAASARRAWAVGSTGKVVPGRHSKALILSWNGKAWKRAATPALPDASLLLGVAAVSARNAWAVGEYGSKSFGDFSGKTLILHWNGRRWTRVPGPAGVLLDITARSARDAWAVGTTRAGGPLIIRWNGRAWHRVASPQGSGQLGGVAAASSRSAWAFGFTRSEKAVALRWNGRVWTRVPAPPGKLVMQRTAVTPSGGAWAVGGTFPDTGKGTPVILRWNGSAWKRVPSPEQHGWVTGLAVLSARSIWAVGATSAFVNGPNRPVIIHWNGRAWTRVASPKTGNAMLDGVAASSAHSAFAVGARVRQLPTGPLILRWNGTAWRVIPG
jgi:hypothetical protein